LLFRGGIFFVRLRAGVVRERDTTTVVHTPKTSRGVRPRVVLVRDEIQNLSAGVVPSLGKTTPNTYGDVAFVPASRPLDSFPVETRGARVLSATGRWCTLAVRRPDERLKNSRTTASGPFAYDTNILLRSVFTVPDARWYTRVSSICSPTNTRGAWTRRTAAASDARFANLTGAISAATQPSPKNSVPLHPRQHQIHPIPECRPAGYRHSIVVRNHRVFEFVFPYV